jgi:hypothetical protein
VTEEQFERERETADAERDLEDESTFDVEDDWHDEDGLDAIEDAFGGELP